MLGCWWPEMSDLTQKGRWAARAEKRGAWADAAEAKGSALTANHSTDWAFVSQPGHMPARARQIAQSDRAMRLQAKAAEHREKAAQLARMAATNKGDAERARQERRDAAGFQVGDRAVSIFFGPCEVVGVNTKTVRIRHANGETTQDKSYFQGRP